MGKRQRRTWAEVDLDILEENFLQVKKMTKAAVCCVIKADAYGHGATYLARKYESLGADFFAVSNLEEALQLRNAGIKLPILILGYTPVSEAGLLCSRDISQCVYSLDYAESWRKKLKRQASR